MKKAFAFLKCELGRIILGLSLFIPAFILDKCKLEAAAVILYIAALIVSGLPVFYSALRGILRRDLLDEKFLMSIASVGAMIVGEMSEGVAVMLFFLVGEYFEHRAVAHSRRSIKALMDIRPDEATLLTDDGEMTVDADDVPIGSIIIIRSGERVPLDAEIMSGNADIDTSALTGEALPRSFGIGDEIKSGTVVINGVLTARTLREADESASARVLELVENANERKSRAEAFVTRFSRFYTPIVVALAVLVAVIPPLFKIFEWRESVYNALNFLVISCPCALVISVPMAFFGGIGAAASQGILYKGGNTFSTLARADTFAFDKTGTLTKGELSLTEIRAVGVSEEELLYLAASAEYGSKHPVAVALKRACREASEPDEFTEIAGRGISAVVDSKRLLIGNRSLLLENGVDLSGISASPCELLVARDGEYIGSLFTSDKIKDEARAAIEELRRCGISKTVMLSGDRRENAERVAAELSLDGYHAELLPEEKFKMLEQLISTSRATVYVGDGINDAPSLARADVGIAMGGIGTDSAIEAADVVIMSDDLLKLPTAIKTARKTVRIATENIVFALGVKGAILILGIFGLANMWLSVFADVGVAVLAILNSIRALRAVK